MIGDSDEIRKSGKDEVRAAVEGEESKDGGHL